jgi:hypothetical protein
MEAFATLLVLIVTILVLAGLDVSALRWGADSRMPLGDDHRR